VCIQGREGGFKGVGGEERKGRKSMMVIHLVENSDLLSDSPGPRSESVCYFFSLLPVHPDPERSGRQSGRERERWKQVKFPSHPTPYTLYMYMYSTIESAPYLLIETIFLLEILLAISVVNSCDPLSSRKFIFSE
jgi:hypothetical protein